MSGLLDNQLILYLACFAVGSFCAAMLYRNSSGSRSWKFADLVWVVVGGLSAIAAIISGTYESDRTRFDRQSDVIYATTKGFESNAGRFRLLHCETDRQGPVYRPQALYLCEKIEFLSASTARYRDLPLFLTVSDNPGPLRSLSWLFGDPNAPDPSDISADDMMGRAKSFDPVLLLRVSATDAGTKSAIAALAASDTHADIAAEFQVLATTYKELIAQLDRLTLEWDYLQNNSVVLKLRVLALCLLAFAAPFRLGKSIVELR